MLNLLLTSELPMSATSLVIMAAIVVVGCITALYHVFFPDHRNDRKPTNYNKYNEGEYARGHRK